MKIYVTILKLILPRHFKAARKRFGLTQNSMSEVLHISPRSYSELERGNNLCSTCVFLFFLKRCGLDTSMQILQEIFDVLDKIENSDDSGLID